MNARNAIYTVKAIIAYGATPQDVEPISIDELRVKASAEGIDDDYLDKILTALTTTKEITALPGGRYRLALLGGET